ncbi:MAG TPA: ABC transporter substrate-binding protein [Anaerolineales bacterium]|nr:ABC transporter substrate-binding protein [Anaerolineales bacterium]
MTACTLIGLLLLPGLAGCNSSSEPISKVGILTLLPAMEQIITGFKDGMIEQGYEEGKNIEYVYQGPANDVSKLDAQAQQLVASNVDVIISVTTPGSQAAQHAVQGTDIPIVFIAVTDPIVAGLVTDLNTHSENITGILAGAKGSQSEGRRLEIFLQVAPGIKTLYLPFNPGDAAAMENVNAVRDAANTLGVSFIEAPIQTEEDALNATTPPDSVDAVFLPSDRLVGSVISQFISEANKKNLPTSLNNPVGLESGALMAYGPDFETMGKQGARLTSQILKGVSARELPVEVPDLLLGINLMTANLIHLEVPDEILRAAPIILR